MTPKLKAAIEQVLSLALDMGLHYEIPTKAIDELKQAFDAEPTEECKKTSLIESQIQQFCDFGESNQEFALKLVWDVYKVAYNSTFNHQKSRQAAEVFAKDGFDLKRSSLEILLKSFGEMMDMERKRITKELDFNRLKNCIENENLYQDEASDDSDTIIGKRLF